MISTSARADPFFSFSATSRSTGCHVTRTTDPNSDRLRRQQVLLWDFGPIWGGWAFRGAPASLSSSRSLPSAFANESGGLVFVCVWRRLPLSLTPCFSWVLPAPERTPTASAVFVSGEGNPAPIHFLNKKPQASFTPCGG